MPARSQFLIRLVALTALVSSTIAAAAPAFELPPAPASKPIPAQAIAELAGQLRTDYPRSNMATYQNDNGEVYKDTLALMQDFTANADARFDQAAEGLRQKPNDRRLRMQATGWLHCRVAAGLFPTVTDASTIEPIALVHYQTASGECVRGIMMDAAFMNRNVRHIDAWRAFNNRPMRLPPRQDFNRNLVSRDYKTWINQRLQEALGGAAEPDLPDNAQASAFSLSPLLAGMPVEPYAFNFAEHDQLKQGLVAVLNKAHPGGQQAQKLSGCSDILQTPNSPFAVFNTFAGGDRGRGWLRSCGATLRGDYRDALEKFSEHYWASLQSNERKLQNANLSKLPKLPVEPFALRKAEVAVFEQYTQMAIRQSVALMAITQTVVQGKVVPAYMSQCKLFDIRGLADNMSDPAVKSRYRAALQSYRACGTQMLNHNPGAGKPLMDQVDKYLAALGGPQTFF
jgi:hypothetical protein